MFQWSTETRQGGEKGPDATIMNRCRAQGEGGGMGRNIQGRLLGTYMKKKMNNEEKKENIVKARKEKVLYGRGKGGNWMKKRTQGQLSYLRGKRVGGDGNWWEKEKRGTCAIEEKQTLPRVRFLTEKKIHRNN